MVPRAANPRPAASKPANNRKPVANSTVAATKSVAPRKLIAGTNPKPKLERPASRVNVTSETQQPPALAQTQLSSSTASDSLSVAAQAQSWLFMSSTLETHLNTATRAAHSALEARAKELATDEADIADSRIRFEAERLLDLYEELANPAVASDLPRIVKTFMDTDNACSEAFSTALELASRFANDINEFRAVLSRIDSLQQGALQLESSILSIVNSSPSSKTRVMAVLEAMLRIVRAHNVNLTSARSLLLVCKDNARLRLCSESLQVSG